MAQVENIMQYAGCINLDPAIASFTPGQRLRMQWVVAEERPGLLDD